MPVRTGQPSAWEEIERAEARLDDRARERAQRRRRRAVRARVARWLITLALPVVGTAAFTWMLEAAGGDLRRWTDAQATAALVVGTLWPAALAAWIWRRHAPLAWAPAAVGVCFAQLGLTYGIAFLVLGYGPR